MIIDRYKLIPLQDVPKADRIEAAEHKIDCYVAESEFHVDRKDIMLVSGSYYSRKHRNAYCRKVWNNTSESTDFDYLYRSVEKEVADEATGENRIIKLVPPARVRHIPIVRPMLESLISRMAKRPLQPRIYSVSTEAVDAKMEAHIARLAELRMAKLRERLVGVQMMQRGIQMQEQLMEQLRQQQGQQPDPRIEQALPQLQAAIEEAKMIAQKPIRITEEEREKISNFFKYSYRDLYEQATEGLLMEYIDRNRCNELRQRGFEEKMITDETYYFVWWEEGMVEPMLRLCRPEQVAYPINDTVSDTRKSEWCTIYEPMLWTTMVETYGHLLTKDQIDELKFDVIYYNQGGSYWTGALPDGRRVYGTEYDEMMRRKSISTYRVFWKEVVKVQALVRTDDNGEEYYTLLEDDYEPKDTDKLITRFRTELWSGIRIGDRTRIKVNVRKCAWQPRPVNSLSEVYLPLVGRAVSRYQQPNSLVWTTRDIQELYNILHYQEELIIALSGVRGIVYDISQKPEGYSNEELMYYMKQGLLLIETVGEGGRKNTTFNQFQSYDQTVAPAVGVITQIKQSLVDLVRMITGVMPQMQGQTLPTDQVGTSQMALQQGYASTEIYYQEDGYIWQSVCEMIANAFPMCYRETGVRKIRFDKTKQQVVAYPKGVDGQFAAVVASGDEGQKALEEAKMGIQAAYSKGIISISQLLSMQDLTSIHDIRVAIKDFEEKANGIMQQQQQAQMGQQMQLQQQMKQMEAQMAMQLKQVEGQMAERLATIKGQIELQKAQLEAGIGQADIQAKIGIAQMNDSTKRYDIETNTMIEASYLELEKQKLQNEDATKRLDRTLSHIEAGMKHNSEVRKSKGKAND